MIKLLRSATAIAAVSCAALMVPATAHGTPSDGVTAVTYADIEIPADLVPFIPAGVHVVAKQITIAPGGGTTGWHYHDGPVLGIVQAGTLSHPGPDCKPVIFKTGDFINEAPGDDNVHQGQNLGKVPVILDVVYLEPLGKPLFEDALAPPCAAK